HWGYFPVRRAVQPGRVRPFPRAPVDYFFDRVVCGSNHRRGVYRRNAQSNLTLACFSPFNFQHRRCNLLGYLDVQGLQWRALSDSGTGQLGRITWILSVAFSIWLSAFSLKGMAARGLTAADFDVFEADAGRFKTHY